MPITRLGYERLYWRLQYLKRHVRREVAQDLAEARGYGITNRNLQWRTARERQAFIESCIEDLEEKLASCEVVISPLKKYGRVEFGLVAKVINGYTGQTAFYQIVGPYESDASAGRLSINSPVGRGLLGQSVGQWITVYAPAGVRRYMVMDILDPGEAGELTPLDEDEP